MSRDDTDAERRAIDGTDVDTAVGRVCAREESVDRETARRALETVAEDGTVSWDGAEEALAHASKVVSTPETRIELAELELEEARETASPVADLDTVTARLDRLASRLEQLNDQIDGLGSKLDSLVHRLEARTDLFEVALELHRLESASNELQGGADDLKLDVEAFERWLSTPAVRYRELEGDLEVLEESFDELEAGVDRLADAVEGGESSDIDDVGAFWFGAVLQHRTLQFMADDIGAEVADVRTLADQDDEDRIDGIDSRLDTLSNRADDVGSRLDGLADRAWIERFGGEIATLNSDLDALRQPADWGEVQRLLDERRSAVEE